MAADARQASGYRPDIEGLRALAVAAVVLFHAGAVALPGGYVGVDVFFVISGYLITRQVVGGTQRGSFSFVEFFLRRVRRLLPAALATAILTTVFAAALLPPFRLAEIAQSAAATAVSIANIHFWLRSGYWAPESENQPLLHMWSLSAEEQFYLVWPLLLVALVTTRARRWALPILVAGTALSIVVTAWATDQWPAAAFYLTPFRAFEFALGAMCVWLDRLAWPRGRVAGVARAGAWLSGLALILWAVLAFDEAGTDFPGLAAVVPTAGTALVIAARRPALLDRALSNPVMTYVGLRSYSLYLVHWPVLVYARDLTERVSLPLTLALLALMVLLAEAMYRFIERPLRVHGTGVRASAVAAWRRFGRLAAPVLGLAVVTGAVALGTAAAASAPSAYSVEVRAVASLSTESVNAGRFSLADDICGGADPLVCGEPVGDAHNVLVLGDSFGPDGLNVVSRLAPDANFLIASQAGCPPLRDLRRSDYVYEPCPEMNDERFAQLERLAPRLDVIVVAMRLDEGAENRVASTIEWLRALGPRVVVLGVGPQFGAPVWQTVLAHNRLDGLGRVLHDDIDIPRALDDAYARLTAQAGGHYLPRWDVMCSDEACRASASADLADLMMYDSAHLTGPGAAATGDHLARDPELVALFR
ncbi:acyltransferase family protein [Microbacterium sp. Marseille-Q6965]|uniref:acyltransferase family protein n=1 Tax=Microbacterium sp. Marseille-Q6965 TaxID=2965072 RepID=UPI0021B83223|nr:acyltransferase family protein [Microbacterium sp. Marseille-Q6965]